MEKDKPIGILLLVISILIILLLVGLNLQTFIEASAELALIAVGTIATLGLKFLFFPQKSVLEKSPMFHWTDFQLIQSAISKEAVSKIPDLSHLNIRYSRRKDTADKKPHSPYFIINTKTEKAYWVQTELLVLNKRNIIKSNTHENEAELRKYLKDNKITLIENNPNFGDLC